MPLAIAYYVLMLIWLVLGAVTIWHSGTTLYVGSNIILFLLFIVIGLKIFGPPIHA